MTIRQSVCHFLVFISSFLAARYFGNFADSFDAFCYPFLCLSTVFLTGISFFFWILSGFAISRLIIQAYDNERP